MWKILKNKVWQWSSVLIAAPSVTLLVMLVRLSGLLQMLELAAYDQLFILRNSEKQDERIVIVEIDEEAIRKLEYPIPDRKLAQILQKIKQHQPRAIGLDFYRDKPVGKGYDSLAKVFESTPNLVGVQKVAGSIDSATVNPPPILKELDRVGANDFPLDADGKIRRGFFYLADKDGNQIFSFSFKLAYLYLNAMNIYVGLAPPDNQLIQVGKVVFTPFGSNDGGYVRTPDGDYQVLLNYRGDIEKFQSVSVIDVLENRVPKDLMKNRIVLIGATASSLKDLFYTPYSANLFRNIRRMAGVTVHANAISQILDAELSDRPLIKTWNEEFEWLWTFSWSLVGAILIWLLRSSKRKILPLVSLVLAGFCLLSISYLTFLYGWWIPVIPPMLGLFGSAVGVTAFLAQSASKIRKTFGRYLNDEVVANLLESPEGLKLGGQRRNITIFTSDLRGFTATSERLPAEEVIKIINLYLGYMADVITEYQGTIDEFMGDGILVLFGAPTAREDDATRAIACAVAMQQAMEPVNQKIKEMGLPKLEMGIGINTGEVVVGNIGSEKRTKYGIVGKQVNLTYRIESYTVGGQIFISESTLKQVEPIVKIIGERQVKPKGVQQPITIYEVGGIAGDYNLYLKQEEELFVKLSQPIMFEYAVLDGKDISDTLQIAKLIQLSENAAEVCIKVNSDEVISIPQPLTNMKMNLLVSINGAEKSGDIYAKVLEKPAASKNSFYIRFTNKPPEVEAYLDSIYKSMKKDK
ncbi:putative transmembrane sensor domain protein [Rivularia sp. PCC 7116]|uniref:CHASE2 domain-containing protein n=1 Tax=Rivularia sp. PCC 7116 TaxID=373994 RepID=UPI00029EC4AD|nr:adenylate/guanylate cyclase domain-containing protein [Rivularia sp. PCC 7116]AFY58602.1 putative transmembrane sensor domain protein [Rivularia sp. PCC 7116]